VEVNGGSQLDPASVRLVAITDSLRDGIDGLVGRAVRAVAGGATMVQLRLKDESARTLVEVARALCAGLPTVPVLVNARTDVALAAGAAGVHLGPEDLAPETVRRVVPAGFRIGASAGDLRHATLLGDADYIAIGPAFAPATGSSAMPALGAAGIASFVAASSRPIVAVGGISAENAAEAVCAGAAGVAVISAILGASDPMRHARALRDVLDASGR
jgi:thiamine-phosphate pyrophosphorylase